MRRPIFIGEPERQRQDGGSSSPSTLDRFPKFEGNVILEILLPVKSSMREGRRVCVGTSGCSHGSSVIHVSYTTGRSVAFGLRSLVHPQSSGGSYGPVRTPTQDGIEVEPIQRIIQGYEGRRRTL